MIKQTWHKTWNEFMTPEIIKILENIELKLENENYYPNKQSVLRFLDLNLDQVKYIIVGMEPYPSFNLKNNCPQATGRSFEVSEIDSWNDKFKQSSLRNILKAIYYNETGEKQGLEEIRKKINDGSFKMAEPKTWFNDLEKQGVMFLNSTLTVRANCPGSHTKIWAKFREKLFEFLSTKDKKWMLWGKNAQTEVGKFLNKNSIIYTAPHPRLDTFVLANTFVAAKEINWKGI